MEAKEAGSMGAVIIAGRQGAREGGKKGEREKGRLGGRKAGTEEVREGVWVLLSLQAGREGGSMCAVILAVRQGGREYGCCHPCRQARREEEREGGSMGAVIIAGRVEASEKGKRENGRQGGKKAGREEAREYGCCHPCR